MKCTDRELLEKLRWLKERADQRRSAVRARAERAAFAVRASVPLTVASLSVTREIPSGGEPDASPACAAPSDAGAEGSIPRSELGLPIVRPTGRAPVSRAA